MPGGLRKVEPPVRARIGWEASRASDLGHAGGDRHGRAGVGAQAGPGTTAPCGKARVAIGEGQVRRGHPTLFAGAGDEFRPVEDMRRLAAIGAGVHRHRAADRAGNAGEEFQPGQAGGGGMFRDRHVQRGGAGNHPVGFGGDGGEAARRA